VVDGVGGGWVSAGENSLAVVTPDNNVKAPAAQVGMLRLRRSFTSLHFGCAQHDKRSGDAHPRRLTDERVRCCTECPLLTPRLRCRGTNWRSRFAATPVGQQDNENARATCPCTGCDPFGT